ncbi:DUF3389 domain-containing protein [Shewanella eurypsychrophilus]|uniref:DUF3389 domain-containing protein n=1 Tax=Shewanella eurypsychrophilus TaxID=2593656 RepID=A0ABX6V508_9GAMM|nr:MULTISPECIES: DUF3389 domain-containing protein [Shewanella]QFU22431.1 DUF3389 family protein [Shewanella sp. YLB-09]QPG57718.1 DUF3389 domain-containing protein [Shewanella eurypsychrophilus]
MVIDFSQGKIILTPFEVQVRFTLFGMSMYAMVEDIKFIDDALIMHADAGAVRWSLKLDSPEQIAAIREELGV